LQSILKGPINKKEDLRMVRKKILYISGSIGLGHVSKDIAIAEKIRAQNPEVEITWLAADPADVVLEKKGENIHPYSKQFTSYSSFELI